MAPALLSRIFSRNSARLDQNPEFAPPFGSRLEDLDWIDIFSANVRPYVRVRREDNVLIKVPVETYAINPAGIALLERALGGEKIRDIALSAGAVPHPERLQEIHAFFCDVRDMLSGKLGDGKGRLATSTSIFSGSFTRYPVLSELALTYRCNLQCRFCYAGCNGAGGSCLRSEAALSTNGADALHDGQEMTREEVMRVLEIIARDAKVPSISFTGGEPTLCPSLPEYVTRARELDLRVNLITNGVACADANLVSRLADARLNSAQVSLEGPDLTIHDALTQRAGSFEKTVEGILRLRTAGLRVHTNTTICSVNAPHLDAIIRLAKSLGLDRVSMNHVIPAGTTALGANHSVQITYAQIGDLVLRARDAAAREGLAFHWYSPSPLCMFNPIAHGLGNKGCAACDGLLHVNPSGDVLPCSSFPEPVGNLLRTPFEEIWFGERAQYYKRKQMAHSVCKGCEHFALCQGACVLYWRAMGYGELLQAAPMSRRAHSEPLKEEHHAV